MPEMIPLSKIVRGKTQVRVAINEDQVTSLMEAYESGIEVPPIALFTEDNEKYFVGDGHHRLTAQINNNHDLIEADVAAGGEDEAIIHNLTFNSGPRGLPLSRADKQKAARMALERWGDVKSNREIAAMIHISHTTVGEVRTDLGGVSPSKKNSAPAKKAKVSGKVATSKAKDEEPDYSQALESKGDVEVEVLTPPEIVTASPVGSVLATLDQMRLTIGKAVRMADEANQSRKYAGQVKIVHGHLNQALEAIAKWKGAL